MTEVKVTMKVHFATRNRGRREVVEGPRPVPVRTSEGALPRVTRLMALAVRIQGLITGGAIKDQAEAAMVGQVTRARMTQVMNLLLLAPDIQLAILELPRVRSGRAAVTEQQVRSMATIADWGAQREAWKLILARRIRS